LMKLKVDREMTLFYIEKSLLLNANNENQYL